MMKIAPKYRGLIGTLAVHAVLLLLMLLITLRTTHMPDDYGGITINFGTDFDGSGVIEPIDQQANEPESMAGAQPHSQPKQLAQEQAEEKAPDLLTQEEEEAPTLNRQDDPVDEAELKRQEELARQRELELERQRQEEAERLKKQQEEAAKNRLRDLMSGTFGGKNETGGATGEGAGTTTGNEGDPEGSTESTKRDSDGQGVSYDLGDRRHDGPLVKPDYQVNDYGVVVVRIVVNQDGKVAIAEAGVRGTTTTNPRLINAAREAALKTRFSRVDKPGVQQGTITYRFQLN